MLTEEMLPTENIHAGPLTERLMSALSIEALPGLADSVIKGRGYSYWSNLGEYGRGQSRGPDP